MQSPPNNLHHCCLGDALLCPGSGEPRARDTGGVWRLRRYDRRSEAAPGGVATDALFSFNLLARFLLREFLATELIELNPSQ